MKIIHDEWKLVNPFKKHHKKKIKHFNKEYVDKQLLELGFLNVTIINEENVEWSGMIFTFPAYICIRIETGETSMPDLFEPEMSDELKHLQSLFSRVFHR